MNIIIQIKNNKTLVQMSCVAYIVYTFHMTLHYANFGQFKAKQVLKPTLWTQIKRLPSLPLGSCKKISYFLNGSVIKAFPPPPPSSLMEFGIFETNYKKRPNFFA